MSGWPTALVTATELLRVAEGNPMLIVTSEGRSVLLRLPTAQEFRQAAAQAGNEISEEEAARMVAPLPAPTFGT